ncbi:hypothetical protein D3C72_1656580 [compost metagenome]
MAICPRWLSISWRSSSARSSTTVLAVERQRPNTRPEIKSQPSSFDSPIPNRVATAICATAPGIAICLTARRSLSEKWRPTPNINRITPISASSGASEVSATKPGVKGPASTPAARYPTSGEMRRRFASIPRRKASTNPPTMVVIKGVELCIQTPSSYAWQQRGNATKLRKDTFSLLHLFASCLAKLSFFAKKQRIPLWAGQ